MHKSIFTVVIIFLFGSAILLESCEKDDEIVITDFQVYVDSIKAPDTISLGEVYQVKFYGFLGETDCYIFQKFAVDMPEQIINVTVVGGYTEDQECDSVQQYLSGELLKIYEMPAGNYLLKIDQPRDIPIEAALYIKE